METILMLDSATGKTKVLWSSASQKMPLFDNSDKLQGFYTGRDESEKVFSFEGIDGLEFCIDEKKVDYIINWSDKNMPASFYRSRVIF